MHGQVLSVTAGMLTSAFRSKGQKSCFSRSVSRGSLPGDTELWSCRARSNASDVRPSPSNGGRTAVVACGDPMPRAERPGVWTRSPASVARTRSGTGEKSRRLPGCLWTAPRGPPSASRTCWSGSRRAPPLAPSQSPCPSPLQHP